MATANPIQDLLDEFGVETTEAELADQLRPVLEARCRRSATTLPELEARFLTQHSGVVFDPYGVENPAQVAGRKVKEEISAIARSVSVAELAEQKSVDPSRIRHRVADRSLYGVRRGRTLRLPLWQFDENMDPIPHLATVLAALPRGLHPLEVENWMTLPDDSLIVDDQATSVREWLVGAGGLAPVLALADTIDRW